jgi:hypothetical protein
MERGGPVWMFGDARAQEMVGNGAANVLVSGGGADRMTGGGGADFFAFERTAVPASAVIVDFDARDKILLDDRFFGLGGGGVDLRPVAPELVSQAVRLGVIAYDAEARALSVPAGGLGGGLYPVATFEAPPALGLDDLFLF